MKTATGPDDISPWVWKDQVEIFIICKIWSLSLKFTVPDPHRREELT